MAEIQNSSLVLRLRGSVTGGGQSKDGQNAHAQNVDAQSADARAQSGDADSADAKSVDTQSADAQSVNARSDIDAALKAARLDELAVRSVKFKSSSDKSILWTYCHVKLGLSCGIMFISWGILWYYVYFMTAIVWRHSDEAQQIYQEKLVLQFVGYLCVVLGLIGSVKLMCSLTEKSASNVVNKSRSNNWWLFPTHLAFLNFWSPFFHTIWLLFDLYNTGCTPLSSHILFGFVSALMTIFMAFHTLLRVWTTCSEKMIAQIVRLAALALVPVPVACVSYSLLNANALRELLPMATRMTITATPGFIIISVGLLLFMTARVLILGNKYNTSRFPNKKMVPNILKVFLYMAVMTFHFIFGILIPHQTREYHSTITCSYDSSQFFGELSRVMWGPSIGFLTAIIYWLCDSAPESSPRVKRTKPEPSLRDKPITIESFLSAQRTKEEFFSLGDKRPKVYVGDEYRPVSQSDTKILRSEVKKYGEWAYNAPGKSRDLQPVRFDLLDDINVKNVYDNHGMIDLDGQSFKIVHIDKLAEIVRLRARIPISDPNISTPNPGGEVKFGLIPTSPRPLVLVFLYMFLIGVIVFVL